MTWEDAQKVTIKIMLCSLVYWIGNLKAFDKDEKKEMMDLVFSVLTKSLNPNMALLFNKAILEEVQINSERNSEKTKEDMLKIVMDQLNWGDK